MKQVSAAKLDLATKRENEIWLYSYADLITNLLAFFIMMLVVSKGGPASQKIQQSIQKVVGSSQGQMPVDASVGNVVAQLLKEGNMSSVIAMEKRGDGISLSFSGGVFFDSSSADLTQNARETLDKVSPIFLKIPKDHRIDVEGYADARPVSNSDVYPSNWELSAARAGSVVRYLVLKGVDPKKLRAIGYGDTRPVSKDLDENRRVVISIGKGRV